MGFLSGNTKRTLCCHKTNRGNTFMGELTNKNAAYTVLTHREII